LRLKAEMKLPGRAWLEFEVEPVASGSRIRQTAEFDPVGLFGVLYWYGIYPLHQLVFAGMLRRIAEAAMSGPRPLTPVVQVLALVGFLAVTFAAAAIGGAATSASVQDWFPGLAKPTWNPPSWLFGPVWGVLYTAMATAAWLVWRTRPTSEAPLLWYWGQLVLNALWSVAFFGMRSPALGVVVILLLLAAIELTRRRFSRVSKVAGILLLPYLAWVSFAAVLNIAIWSMN
jgi:translocator protein